jgi:signal transduction histidine kinase/ActR/RegA family two-component response regulator
LAKLEETNAAVQHSPTPLVDPPRQTPDSSSRAILEVLHCLLCQDECRTWPVDRVIADLAAAAGAQAAGLADLSTGRIIVRVASAESKGDLFGEPEAAGVLTQVRDSWTAVPVTTADRSWLLVPAPTSAGTVGWLLWLEDYPGRPWSEGERAALLLAAQVLARASGPEANSGWGQQLDRIRKQQRLEETTRVVQRLAHDYGNILTTILGFSELSLGMTDPGRSLSGYFHEVHRAARLGSHLTDQLRLFSRRGSPGPRAADVAAVVALEAAHARTTWGTSVRLDLDLPPGLPPVFITAEMLQRILHELFTNAREAISGEGTVFMSCRLGEKTDSECLDLWGAAKKGPCLEITVADTGIGLSAEARQAILSSPFFTTKPRHRGLGLATVYGILCYHGGGFQLEPRPGSGTVVRVVLPLSGTPPAFCQPTSARGAESPSPAVPVKEKVLVVDDDPLILSLVTTTLERDGYRVQTALSGAEALHCYTTPAAEPFRLVLSDVLMPCMNGVDLARRLVQHDARVNLLFMSGQVSSAFAPENWGGSSFPLLRKPFRPEGLLQAVRAALDTSRTRPQNWPTLPPPVGPTVPSSP